MTAYRDSDVCCEHCTRLHEEINNLKFVQDEVEFFPFQSFENTYCPYCSCQMNFNVSYEYRITLCTEKRKHITKKRFFRADQVEIEFEACPQIPHFHKECVSCEGKWVESTGIETKKHAIK